MNIFQMFWKNSIFTRLFATFLLMMIPIYAVGIEAYNRELDTLREEISSSMLYQASFYLEGLEKDIQSIRKAQYECMNDDNLNDLAAIPEGLSEIEKRQAILRLQQRLQIIKNSSTYIEDVAAHIPAMGKSIYAGGNIDSIPAEEFKILNTFPSSAESQILYWNNRILLGSSYPIYSIVSKRDPTFSLGIELSAEEMRKALTRFNNYPDSGTILDDADGQFEITSSNTHSKVAGAVLGHVKRTAQGADKGVTTLKLEGKSYFVIHTSSKYLGMTLVKYVPEDEVFKPLKRSRVWISVLTVLAVVIIILFSISTYRFVHMPLKRLVKSFKKVEKGELDISIQHHREDEFGYLYNRFNAMVENLNTLIRQVYQQKILTQHAQLKQLQSQINPHFLYNSFFILHRMIKGGESEEAIGFSEQLGDYFRYITRNAADDVPLCEELAHARIYAEIQMLRFSNRIRVEYGELPQEFQATKVPRLILQPLIENAFEHGLRSKMAGGLLRIDFEASEDGLSISIEDNGSEIGDEEIDRLQRAVASQTEEAGEITAVVNIHRRLSLKFGEGSGLDFSRGETGGLRVLIRIAAYGGQGNV